MRVLYIDVDSLRPDHLGCYGYGRDLSPNIDAIAARGVRWERCHASDAPCMPSRTSLFSGQFGIHHGCVSHVGSRATPFPETLRTGFVTRAARNSWMQCLRDAGMHTCTFSSFADRHSAHHWLAGFSEVHDNGGRGHEGAEAWMPEALDWLERRGQQENWFLHLTFWDVHVPYHTPENFKPEVLKKPLLPEWITQAILDKHRSSPGIRSAKEALFLKHAQTRPDLNPAQMETLEDFQRMIDGYDTSIAYVDYWVGQILEQVEALGIRDETAIILSADHGENLGELNAYAGHCFADAFTTRIPMIIDWPGVTNNRAGESEPAYTYHFDLAPTVCEALAAEIPERWDAESLFPLLKGSSKGRPHLICSQLAQTCQRSVRFENGTGDYLYLRSYRKRGYEIPDELLFDLRQDPHETQDLSETHPDPLRQGRHLLAEWHQKMMGCNPNEDPLKTVLCEPDEAELMGSVVLKVL